MSNAFKSRIALKSEVMYGDRLAKAEFISKTHYLTTTLEVYEVATADNDKFIITARNQLGWVQVYSAPTAAECLEWVRGSWLPAEVVVKLTDALTEKPKPKRGRPAAPKVTYCTRKRRDGSETSVKVSVGDAA